MSDLSKSEQVVSRRFNEKLAMWLFLGGEVVLFTWLMSTIVIARINGAADYPAFRSHLSVVLVGVNTGILIVSSYLVVSGLQAIRRGNVRSLQRSLLGVMLFGALFLGGQALEWASLFREGITPATEFGTPFFTVTGIHGLHVLMGLIWAGLVLVSSTDGAYSAEDDRGVDIFGLYWHFVDIVWIVLFMLIYLL